MKKLLFISTAMLLIAATAYPQVAINKDGSNPNAGSILHVKGDTTNKHVLFEPGTNGNVGIGTTSPSDDLSVGEKVLISADPDPSNPPSGYCVIFFDGIDLKVKNSNGIVVIIAEF